MKQKGFALLTVLLVMALVALLIGTLIYQQGRQIRQSAVMLNQAQAVSVAAGLEAWVKKGLAADAQAGRVDHLGELWARPLPPVSFAGGQLSGQLRDAQAKVNLNNLTLSGERLRFWRAVVERLLAQAQVPVAVDVLQDWVDADDEPLPEGAESDEYLLRTPAYRTPNRPVLSLLALRGAKGVTRRHVEALRPLMSALPKPAPVNVNTAEAAVLGALAPMLDGATVRAWVEARRQAPAKKVEDFWRFVAAQTQQPLETVQAALPEWALSVSSRYFELTGRLAYGEAQVNMGGLFHREGGRVRLVMRWFAPQWSQDAAGTL